LDLNNPKDLEKANNTTVVIPQPNAKFVNVLKRSPEVKNILKNEYENIKKGKLERRYLNDGIKFELPSQKNYFAKSWRDKMSLFGILHNADIFDIKQKVDGSITLVISDFYDFERWLPDEKDNMIEKFIKEVNNNAYHQQKAGKLRPYMLYVPLEFSPEELREMGIK